MTNITYPASPLSCCVSSQMNRVQWLQFETIFKSKCLSLHFPTASSWTPTIQQWRYNTNRETLTSVPSHKNIKHQDCLVPSGLLYKIQSMFMIGFLNVIPMDWGFTLQFPHLLYNTALLLNSQKQRLVRISGVLHNNKLRMIALNSVQDEGMYFIASYLPR